MPRFVVVLVAVLALTAGLVLSVVYRSSGQQHSGPHMADFPSRETVVGRQRPDFHLGSTTGRILSPADFAGQVLLINFWATWCTPCRKEMPMLMALQRRYGDSGLQVIGIALDEMQKVREFTRQLNICYPVLVGEGDVMQTNYDYGNVSGVLPYSVLVDRDGIIRWQFAGEIRQNDITDLLDTYL